ncbi:phage minor capsid protein [Mediterraneibacter gnavus]|uniref:Minor capsid protein n=1 Tax=Mediterraneibacter gnavus TaxID=33038 RepID=A0AAJ3KN45_MEDGN|nr:phage minor capsid protein [Mediterraneibacter gnavus]NSC84298.1 minor capsid protein [Mediterraneibacter gnavus]NSI27185.1 minor capsid protein [Mediterraneibacter gnavus]NSI30724.1 minor capsid protein [Mediterraneibacter gnavus]NSI46586.1 minor capsid protein [Mediterraneibacter gnavus]NSI50027.1 minor capsid protein [Mediterraneibacter gnavus]
MQPKEMEHLPLQLEKMFLELQNRIMRDVVRRIKKTGGITSTADYQLNRIQIIGNSTEFIESEIKRLSGLTDPELWEIYDTVIEKDYTRVKEIYEQVNAHFTPYEDNEQMQTWAKAILSQTKHEIQNITRSMGFALDYGGKKVFTPFSEYYQKYLDRACMDIVTGAFDYNTVLRRVVKEMTASGIRTVNYASGYGNRAPVAVRRAVMTGVHQLAAQINEQVAKDLGTDTYEVTWHAGHRPSHWWGGNVYTKQQLISICRLGEVDGLCGANCKHSYFAFVDGVSVRTYTPEQLREMEANEQVARSYQGKSYNAYEAQQRQRALETRMRKQRSDIDLLKKGKASQLDIQAAQAKYLNTLREYQGFSKKMELPEQMQRVYMDGLGRVLPGRIFESRISNIKKKTAEKIFDVEITKEMDTVLAANLYKNLNKSNVGKTVLDFIKTNHISVNVYYSSNTISETGLEGLYGSCIGNHIYINGVETQSIRKTAETIIHEATHIRLDIGGDQHAEAVCDYFAELHTKGKLTGQDIRNIIKSVKGRYSDREWRLK